MVEDNKLKIHQTLHGYRDGHSLLSTSTELTNAERKELQILSDYSGTGIETKFSDYLTGYPLTNSKFYALAKTWYADEMPRPGCVWTHTLLIDISVIWAIRDFNILEKKFVRPNREELRKYNEPISVSLNEINKLPRKLTNVDIEISCCLYSSQKPLILYADTEAEFRPSVLTIWNYQWPRLKRGFSFCTGAISLRTIGKAYFDLQVVPYSRSRNAVNRNDENRFEFFESNLHNCDPKFIEVYRKINPDELLDFMTKFGSDISGKKENFRLLLDAYSVCTNSEEHTFNQVKLILDNVAKTNEGRLLRINLVESAFKYFAKSRFDLIKTILESDAMVGLSWDFPKLILSSWESKSLTNQQLFILLNLFIENQKDNGELLGILTEIPVKEWISKIELYKSIVPQLLTHNINLIYSSIIWKAEDDVQEIWFNSLIKLKKIYWKDLVNQMLSANNDRFVVDIYNAIGAQTFSILFEWLNKTNAKAPISWQYLIKQRPVDAFRELCKIKLLSENQIAVIPNILSPTDAAWFEVAEDEFEVFFDKVSGLKDQHLQTSIYTFFLTTTFNGGAQHPEIVTSYIFQPLHDNLKNSIFDFHSWNRFKMLMGRDLYDLVDMDFFSKLFNERNEVPDWDHCEFLRRSLISCFAKNKWDPFNLISIVRDEYTFNKIVEFGCDVKPIKKMLKHLRNTLQENRATRSFYYKILEKNL